jgi:hypothetical protein
VRPIGRVLEQVRDARAHNGYFKAHCPAHDDREPSLSISEGEDGRVLLNCFYEPSVRAHHERQEAESRKSRVPYHRTAAEHRENRRGDRRRAPGPGGDVATDGPTRRKRGVTSMDLMKCTEGMHRYAEEGLPPPRRGRSGGERVESWSAWKLLEKPNKSFVCGLSPRAGRLGSEGRGVGC